MLKRPRLLVASAAASLSLLAAGGGAAAAQTAHGAHARTHGAHARTHGAPARTRGACDGPSRHGRSAHSCRAHGRDTHAPGPRPQRLAPRTPLSHERRVAGFNRARAPRRSAPASTEASASSVAATIAQVLATPCQNTEVMPEEGNLEAVKAAVMCLINHERAQNGVPPLQTNPQLEAAATGHARELVSANYFAHVSPSGETPVDRIRAAGYIPDPQVGYVIGENLAWGTYSLATPQAIVNAWIASPGHLANILEARYQDTGIGVTATVPSSLGGGSTGATYAEEFGVILH